MAFCRLRMEDGRYDVFRREFFLWDQVRQRVDGGHEHGVCDPFGAGVQGAAEQAGEDQHVVDLVR